MKKLHKLRISSLTLAEAGQLIKRNLEDLQTANVNVVTDIHIQTYTSQMTSDSVLFDKALLQIQKNEETDALQQLDHARDLSFSALNRQLRVFELSNDSTEIAAYQSLKILFVAYKNTPALNYEAETNTITNLIQDLAKVQYATHVITLNLGNYIARLLSANNSFNSLFSTRSVDIASTVVYDAKAIRKVMTQNYNAYINYVLSLSNAADTPYYNVILDVVNTIRKYYSDLLARRKAGIPPVPGAPI